MSRIVVALSILAVFISGPLLGSWMPATSAAQAGTPVDDHELIGSWLIYEANPPGGGDPVFSGVATFFDDGNVVLSFGDQRYQGSWIGDEPYEATFTVIAPAAGGFGELEQLRGSVEVATDGGPFRGIYTYEVVRADGSSTAPWRGPLEGHRVEVQAPEPYP